MLKKTEKICEIEKKKGSVEESINLCTLTL